MGIRNGHAGDLAAIAWVVAFALAVAFGAGAAAFTYYRRSRRAELRLRQLEGAVAEFCGAFQSRLSLERSRHQHHPSPPGLGEPPAGDAC